MRKLRVAFTSNPHWTPSGYSQQTADIEKLFVKSGWTGENFALFNMFGQHGGKFKDELGIWNYPLINHPTGSDAMVMHGQHFKPDIIIGLFDIHTQDPNALQQLPRFIPWVPVDYDPVPMSILQNLRFSNRIIAMSKFGQEKLKEAGFSSTYIPHHVDTSIFKPMDKKEAKAKFNIPPDMFVFGMVSANKDMLPRKSFGNVLEAFAQFVKKHPRSLLYIHTNPNQLGGYPVMHHAGMLGLQQHVIFPDLYKWSFDTSKEEMNLLLNSFDVLLSPSSTEGFGIPIIEAQACGTPVIVNDYTSMPELIQNEITGYKTKRGCHHMMPIGSFMTFPDTQDLLAKMERIHGMKIDVMGKAAVNWVEKNFAMNTIWDQKWLPFLEKIENELYTQPLTNPQVTA